MLVKLLTYTPEPDKLVAAAAKLCYSDAHIETIMDGLTPEKTDAFLKKLSSMGHQSPTEHAYFTFGIEGVSRTLLAQITRHRIASFSVQSQRYVRRDDFRYVIPPVIENDPEAKATFIEAMNRDAENYLKEVERLEAIHTKVLMENGASKKDAKKMASKFANEDARFLLPNACETKMVVTMNARSLHNFFAMRCCNRAQWEIHELADRMLVECKKVAPNLFLDAGPKCMFSSCQEGPMSCGKAKEVREKYKAL